MTTDAFIVVVLFISLGVAIYFRKIFTCSREEFLDLAKLTYTLENRLNKSFNVDSHDVPLEKVLHDLLTSYKNLTSILEEKKII